MSKKVTNESYIERCNIKHNYFYKYDHLIYTGMWNKVTITCPIHGNFEQLASNHKDGTGCPKCNPRRKKDTSWFIQEANKVEFKFGIKYNYSKTILDGMNNKLVIECPIHGEFSQYPWNHLNGSGCNKCGDIGKRKSTQQFLNTIPEERAKKFKFDKVNYNTSMEKVEIICKNNNHGSFHIRPNDFLQGAGCPKCSQLNKSKEEISLLSLIPESISNDRTLIAPLEIDILNHKYKFGIEYNGIIWHSYGHNTFRPLDNYHKLNKNKHLDKTKSMESKDYQLFHILDAHWLDPIKKEIWKSIINNKIGNTTRIFARKTKVIKITNKKFVNDYLNSNHLQGSSGWKIALGLEFDGKIYAIMTFGRSRYDKNIEYELLRFCSFKNTTVVGGASKLLKYFERNFKPESLVSYANRDWSQGNLYNNLGFTIIRETSPNYFYIRNNIIISRLSAQKHKLKKLLGENFNDDISERDNMINNGYRIYYDTGNLVFHKHYKKPL